MGVVDQNHHKGLLAFIPNVLKFSKNSTCSKQVAITPVIAIFFFNLKVTSVENAFAFIVKRFTSSHA